MRRSRRTPHDPIGLINDDDVLYGGEFTTAIATLSTLETAAARHHHAEITALVTAHRNCAQFLEADADPAAVRAHGPHWRVDTWLSARQILLAEYAPACALSLSTASSRINHALAAHTNHPDAVTALLHPASGMTVQKLRILIRETEALHHQQCAELDAIVLPRAAGDNTAQWRRRIRAALLAVLGTPIAKKIRKNRQSQRYVAISPDGDIAHLLGELPLAQAQAFTTALDDLAGDAAPGDTRTHQQRRADALLTCVLGPAAFTRDHSGDPGTACFDEDGQYTIIDPAETGQVTEMWDLIRQLSACIDLTLPRTPLVTVDVTIPAAILAGADTAARATTQAGPACPACGSHQPDPASNTSNTGTSEEAGATDANVTTTDLRAHAVINGLGPIDPDLARTLATDARWRRIVNDPITGIVYDVGTTRYRPPADMRRRIVARDGVCRFPGCTRKAVYCHLDHVTAYPAGPTADANLAALCEFHHRIKHQTGWTPTMHTDGRIDWISPTGRKYTTYPINRQAPPRTTAA
ncbi:HNH endonuclease signature motif containing protein [Antricoccus suffuscus]|nr:HNH endonuclease signature motif containing protein [Antricoccus suffuscus]